MNTILNMQLHRGVWIYVPPSMWRRTVRRSVTRACWSAIAVAVSKYGGR